MLGSLTPGGAAESMKAFGDNKFMRHLMLSVYYQMSGVLTAAQDSNPTSVIKYLCDIRQVTLCTWISLPIKSSYYPLLRAVGRGT